MGLREYLPRRKAGGGAYWLGVVLGLGILISGIGGLVSYISGNDLARTGHRVSATVAGSDNDTVQLTVPEAGSKHTVTIRREGPSLCDYVYGKGSHSAPRCEPITVSPGDHLEVFVDRHDPSVARPVDALKDTNAGTPIFTTLIGLVLIGMCARALQRLRRGERTV